MIDMIYICPSGPEKCEGNSCYYGLINQDIFDRENAVLGLQDEPQKIPGRQVMAYSIGRALEQAKRKLKSFDRAGTEKS